MKQTILALILGAFLGAGLAITIPALADVTLNTNLDRSVKAQGVRKHKLHIEWKADDETIVSGKVQALDGGVIQAGSVTDINILVPATSGAPTFSVTGYAIDAGASESCSGSRSAILATVNDIGTKLENFADNCLN